MKESTTARMKTTTPTSIWVASHALLILRKKPVIGDKELKTTLQDTHNCITHYEIVWKGKEKALAQLYRSWESSF
jgi:hypothetical protein